MAQLPRVLVCDDNADLRENLRELIELLDLEVAVASDACGARRVLDEETPLDLLLTDLRLGADNGLDLLQEARAQHPELPCVLVSGFLDDQTRAQAKACGVDAMFDKPVDHQALLERIDTLITRERSTPPPLDPEQLPIRSTTDRRSPGLHPLHEVDVLIVDDNVDLADNLGEFLSELGAKVRYARNCAEALAAEPPEVALVDIRLPDGSGASLVPGLRDGRETPGEVLLITGHASLDGAISALRQGANAYLLKPIDLDELESAVRRAAETVRMRQREFELTRQLQESEAKLRTLVDHTQVLLVVLDEHGRILQVNAAVEQLTGRDEFDLLGTVWSEAFARPEDREQAEAHLRDAARGSVDVPQLELVTAAGGELRRVSWLTRALLTPRGLRLFRAGMDVTEELANQERAQRAEKLAAVGTLAAGLAHEIRNPLNGASLQLQVLERRLSRTQVEADWQGPVSVVREEISRLGRLVQEFMSFARPRAIDSRSIDLGALLEKVRTLCASDAKRHQVRVELAPIPSSVAIAGDVDRLTQVFLNLVRNAIEASPEGSSVEIDATPNGSAVVLSIRDHGPGIPEELRARVFEPFFTTKEGGTGLGLSICHAIVDQHHGTLEFVVNGGTRAKVTLPLERA